MTDLIMCAMIHLIICAMTHWIMCVMADLIMCAMTRLKMCAITHLIMCAMTYSVIFATTQVLTVMTKPSVVSSSTLAAGGEMTNYFICMCDMTHSYVWHDSCMLIGRCRGWHECHMIIHLQMSESCHTNEWVMSHKRESHITWMILCYVMYHQSIHMSITPWHACH